MFDIATDPNSALQFWLHAMMAGTACGVFLRIFRSMRREGGII